MRTFAILTTAMIGLSLTAPAFAQPGQSMPQTGLPPGAGVGAQNAQPPRAAGQITTTPTGAAPLAATPTIDPPASPPMVRRHYRHRVVHHAAHRRAHVTPAAVSPPAQ